MSDRFDQLSLGWLIFFDKIRKRGSKKNSARIKILRKDKEEKKQSIKIHSERQTDFKAAIISNMSKEHMKEPMENIDKEIKSIKKYQMKILELKNTVIKMKYSLNGFNSQFEMNEEKISELEGDSLVLIQSEEQREKT